MRKIIFALLLSTASVGAFAQAFVPPVGKISKGPIRQAELRKLPAGSYILNAENEGWSTISLENEASVQSLKDTIIKGFADKNNVDAFAPAGSKVSVSLTYTAEGMVKITLDNPLTRSVVNSNLFTQEEIEALFGAK